ncbi:Fumarate reductase flavoprotein subunit precursor [Achromobacter spanius]|nr:FAD-dependent oxidoreductase [Achromobacter spanius]AUA59987.1 3-ketosteroid dehydrogenase [Achromobacter spanius]CAB3628643.1 Fumarate reductase flavoprotein subunit [Achromobacter spanius]SPT37470.1 Fumarate reductase flavoprotein subunit precursor [Achromobacter denitrificans]VEE54793.1 Fumarate reductase flavoprotein subunit precursor [Achromobacter spanius]
MMQVPVLIIGAGACGLTAALRLAQAGIETVLIERDAAPSGSSALSSGFIPAAGSAVQRAAGIEDDAARFAADIQAKAHGTAAPHLVAAYTDAAAPAMDMLARHGLAFDVLDGFLYPGHSTRRMHALPERTGVALVTALERAATGAGAHLLTRAQARDIWVEDAEGIGGDGNNSGGNNRGGNNCGRITAVGCERPDGSVDVIGCQVLILACNGFGGNAAMVAEHLPAMREAVYGGHVGNDGSAVEWGKALGARLADLGAYQGHGSWATPQGALISWAVMMDGGVQINRDGLRFHDETQGYSEAAVHVLAQPGGVAWNVFDDRTLALARGFPDFVAAEAGHAVKTCADVSALAALIGCDAGVLQQTVQGVCPDATDPHGRRFDRTLQAPYHAIKVTGALFHTQGGLDIDAQCRVLNRDGQALPNLLAAGGAARGVSGNDVSGYLSGNGLLSAVAGGYIAAATAASLLGHELGQESP